MLGVQLELEMHERRCTVRFSRSRLSDMLTAPGLTDAEDHRMCIILP